jgi:thiamine-phosphate pyrophosphorylase
MNIGLYVVLDKETLSQRNIVPVVAQLLDAGVKWFQYRDKSSSDGEFSRTIAKIMPRCRAAGAKLILNDRVELAGPAGADGVHVGQEDIPVCEARRVLGREKIIGASVRSVGDALKGEADGANYLGAGAVFATDTKPEAPAIGLAVLSEICGHVKVPVVAIGGINENNVREVVRAGASGVAVVSAILRARDIAGAALRIMRSMGECHSG